MLSANNQRSPQRFKQFNVPNTNTDQVFNKWDGLQMLITGNKPNMIMLTEILSKAR